MTDADSSLYETETMADLCARQGRTGEALAIYRRLLETHPEADARARWSERITTLAGAWEGAGAVASDLALPAEPGVAVAANDDAVTIAWALPPTTTAPTLELLLLQKTPTGVDTTLRRVPLERHTGRIAFAVPALHTALAAVGSSEGDRFVPLARSPRR